MSAPAKQFRLFTTSELAEILADQALAERDLWDHYGTETELMFTFRKSKLVSVRVEFTPVRYDFSKEDEP